MTLWGISGHVTVLCGVRFGGVCGPSMPGAKSGSAAHCVELLRTKADIQSEHCAAGEDSFIVDPCRAIIVGIVHLRHRRDVLVIRPKRQAGAWTDLLASLK